MNKRLIRKMTNKVTSVLYNEYKNHETMVDWGGDDWRWKKHYLRNVSFSLVVYALYGQCRIAPEAHYQYLEYLAANYPEPEFTFHGIFAFNPDNEKHLSEMDNILYTCLHDTSIDARKTVKQVLQVMKEVANQED